MNKVTPAVQNLARRLIAHEARKEQDSETRLGPTLRAVGKLQAPLTKLAGAQGFRSLLSRALTLANAYAPSLGTLRIGTDGSLHDAADLPSHQSLADADDGGAALLAEMIGLLILFIGEALTLQLLRAAWPDAALTPADMEQKETL